MESGITFSGITEIIQFITDVDEYLDKNVPAHYQGTLAQDWARISKIGEELGEAIQAFIGVTGQNPRKGTYGDYDDVLKELMDIAFTAIFALQHFTKDGKQTLTMLADHLAYLNERLIK